jgi:hypothetical protein
VTAHAAGERRDEGDDYNSDFNPSLELIAGRML